MLIYTKDKIWGTMVNIPKSVDNICKTLNIPPKTCNLEIILAQFDKKAELVRYKVKELLSDD